MNNTANTATKIQTAYAYELEDVAFFDPEMADMGNPDGAVYRRFWFVAAEAANGRRWVHEVRFFEDEAGRAKNLARRVLAAGEIDTQNWNEGYSVYGSQAWQAEDNLRAAAHQNSDLAGTVRDF
jgi:hypothetical protein